MILAWPGLHVERCPTMLQDFPFLEPLFQSRSVLLNAGNLISHGTFRFATCRNRGILRYVPPNPWISVHLYRIQNLADGFVRIMLRRQRTEINVQSTDWNQSRKGGSDNGKLSGLIHMQGVRLPGLAHNSTASPITCSRICRLSSCSGTSSTFRWSRFSRSAARGMRWANRS